MKHSKSIIPPDLYYATVIHHEWRTVKDLLHLYLWWMIDTGKYAWHKIPYKIPSNSTGDYIAERMCNQIGIEYYPGLSGNISPVFDQQFKYIRAGLYIEINSNKVNKNIITCFTKATGIPQYDVLNMDKTDLFYNKTHKRTLPIVNE